MPSSPAEIERVRRHTAPQVNRQIDQDIRACVERYSSESPDVISQRIAELDREYDMERTLQTNASILALGGLAVSALRRDSRWLALPATVLGFLLQHATQGWCPPLPVFRRMGVRTRSEIERERFVLKYLRGDFAGIDWRAARRSPETLLAAAER